MKKYSTILISIFSALCSCGQVKKADSTDGLIVDPSIKIKVEEHASIWEFAYTMSDLLIYNNRVIAEFYENDALISVAKEEDNKSSVFKSFYYWRGDTLSIDGAFGLFGGIGFTIKIIKDKATVYHMLAADEHPSYTYAENDSLIYRLEVPCTETKIVLSEIPDSTRKQIVYGYVEFKSGDYYVSAGSAEGKEFLPRKKQRANMRIYFKSAKLEL